MTSLRVSIGNNRKVGADTAILNMCSAHNCPSCKLGFCQVGGQKKCYAMKAERAWPNSPKFRNEQETVWEQVTVDEAVQQLRDLRKKQHYDPKTKARYDLKYVRFSEAGDFKTQADVDKMSAIAEGLKGELVIYGYTARKDLDFSKKSDNLIINGSGFMVDNEFKTVDGIPVREGNGRNCPMDCRQCSACKERKGVTIYVRLH